MSSEETRPSVRRRPRVAAVSVVAAVLLAGGGGAYVAANASGDGPSGPGTPTADGTPPPLTLDDDAQGVAPGEPAPGGVRYRASGELPDGPDSAAVYRLRGVITAAQVTRLAEALDVSGTPRTEGTDWKVGRAGEGPVLTVGKESPGTWSFRAHSAGTDNCLKGRPCGPRSPGSGPGSGPVSEQDAKKAAAPVLDAVGQRDAALDATHTLGAVRVVNADPEVGSLPTYGWATGVQVGSGGQVVGGSGKLTEPVKGDTYPVVGAERAIGLLNESASGGARGGIGGCATPVPAARDAGGIDQGGDSRGGHTGIAPGEPDPGGPQQPCPSGSAKRGPAPVDVDRAVFGLATHFERGRQVLVPSWLFQVRPEGSGRAVTITQPAVDPAYLTPRAAPSPEPTRQGTEPSTGPESRDVRVVSYGVDGRTLTLRFWGGACSDYSAKATESATEVRVAVTETPQDRGKVCILIAKERTERVTLDKPLGDREVVGTDGVAVRRG